MCTINIAWNKSWSFLHTMVAIFLIWPLLIWCNVVLNPSHSLEWCNASTHCFYPLQRDWKFFKDKVFGLTVKPLSHTRWESHVESAKAIKEKIVHIRDALLDIVEVAGDFKTKSDAETLALYDLESFEFMLGMVILYNLLHAINVVSNLCNLKMWILIFLSISYKDLFNFMMSLENKGLLVPWMKIHKWQLKWESSLIFNKNASFEEINRWRDGDYVTQSGEEYFGVG